MKTFYATMLYPIEPKEKASKQKVAKIVAETEEKAWVAAYEVSRQFGAVVLKMADENHKTLKHPTARFAEKL